MNPLHWTSAAGLATLLASEAATIAATAAAMAEIADHPVRVEPMGAGVLVALGPGRYVNRAVGVGPHLDQSEIECIEGFYNELELDPSVQLSATADPETLRLLGDAGFRPDFFRSLLARDLDLDLDLDVGVDRDRDPALAAPASPYRIVAVEGADVDRWLDVIAEGNAITSAAGRARSDEYALAAHAAPGAVDFLAFDGNDPVGCGSIQVAGTAAWLGGAATRPDHRGRGVQGALLAHRLAEARARGCTVAAATATPGGISARNLQRAGLRPVDMQLVLTQRR